MAGKGSSPGERRGGRAKGVPNKIGADVRALAQKYTEEAVNALADIMRNGTSEQARALAADKLLDRGHGKPSQIVGGDKENPITLVHRIERVLIGTDTQI